MVLTGDRDLFQLIEPGVRVMATGRGVTDTKIYDRDAVIDRYGIAPELVPDFVGLKGDTSDNIPGVPGIGEKTATQLLQEWGDLEGVLSNIESISGAKRKQNLTEHAENARISKQLATAVRDVDVDVDFDRVIAREPDRSRLRETFREFELRAPLERLEEALGEDGAAPAERVEEVIELQARQVALAELGALEGELVSFAALRPGEEPDETVVAADARGPGRRALGRGGGGGRGGRARGPRGRDPRRRRLGPGRVRLRRRRTARARSPWRPGRGTRCSSPRPRRSPPLPWLAESARWWHTTGRRSRWPTSPARRRRWPTTRWSRPT